LLRLDEETSAPVEAATAKKLLAAYAEALKSADIVVLSDYAKGVLTPSLIARIIGLAREKGVPVVVDPKTRDVRRYAGASVLTPNAWEAEAISGVDCHDDSGAEQSARAIRDVADVDCVILTRGSQGMTIFSGDGPDVTHIPTVATEVFDVSGAGDTVVAALALALGAGADKATAARIANAAAGLAVAKPGTATVSARELRAVLGGLKDLGDPKIVDRQTASEVVADWKRQGLDVGFTNGCFDLLHPGHVDLLRKARAACDRLVVALNTDASVKRLKGEGRPVQNEHSRALVMSAIKSVDLVTFFDEDTPAELIEALRPTCLVKGSDYTEAQVVGAEFVRSYGGRVFLAPLQIGHSTTSIIARAKIEEKA
jgi:D-beta-D-heptose 7-phosphate kinase/D-beta-D-heptose 1-phosphate adenosyltransferase